MIRPIDLTPVSARARANRRSNTRRWIGAYVVVALVGAIATGGARLRTASLERELGLATDQLEATNERLSAVSEISLELENIANTLELQERVLPRPSVNEVLREIERAAPESMSFTSLTLEQRRPINSATIRAARKAGDDAEPQIATSVSIAGVTPDDASIVRLIQNLERVGIFTGSSLEYSRPVRVRGVEAREFRIVSSVPTFSVARADGESEGSAQ